MHTSAHSLDEFVALRQLDRSVGQSFVDWAGCMLADGADTPALRVLAGERPPFNYFEMGALADRVFRELGRARYSSDEAAAVGLTRVRVAQVLDGSVSQKAALDDLAMLCCDLGYPRFLMDFYSLHHALEDLEFDHVQYYWPGADRVNIRQVIDDYFKGWLREHPRDA